MSQIMRGSCLLVCLSYCLTASAAEWTQFRSPDGNGVVHDVELPLKWSETENLAWKAKIPGRGWASPVGNDKTIWLTTAEQFAPTKEQQARQKLKLAGNPLADQMELTGSIVLRLIAIDTATGKIQHNIELFVVDEPAPIHSLNSFASPSPIWNDGRIYCHFGTFGTACVDAETGKVLWSTKLALDHSVGPGSSPILYQNKLIIPCDGTDQQYMIALSTLDGKPLWKTPRPPMIGEMGDLHKAFSTPLLISHEGRDQVVAMGAQWVVSYDPESGTELWRAKHGDGFSNVPRPVFANGMVYLCTGYMKPQLWAMKLDGSGDVTETHVVWKAQKQIPCMPSPVVVGQEIYFVSDQGVASCLDALTGKTIWQHRLRGNYSASPLAASGYIYFCNHEGETTVLKAGKTPEIVNTNVLEGQLMASPAVFAGALVLRTDSHLYRIQTKR